MKYIRKVDKFPPNLENRKVRFYKIDDKIGCEGVIYKSNDGNSVIRYYVGHNNTLKYNGANGVDKPKEFKYSWSLGKINETTCYDFEIIDNSLSYEIY